MHRKVEIWPSPKPREEKWIMECLSDKGLWCRGCGQCTCWFQPLHRKGKDSKGSCHVTLSSETRIYYYWFNWKHLKTWKTNVSYCILHMRRLKVRLTPIPHMKKNWKTKRCTTVQLSAVTKLFPFLKGNWSTSHGLLQPWKYRRSFQLEHFTH